MKNSDLDERVGKDVEFLAVSRLTLPIWKAMLIQQFDSESKTQVLFSIFLTDQLKTVPDVGIGILGAIKGPAQSWFVGLSAGFKKDIDSVDRKIQGRVLEAIAKIVDAPVTAKGDTVKPLTKEEKFTGCWRYRIGDYRLIYHPNGDAKQVTLVAFESRGDAY